MSEQLLPHGAFDRISPSRFISFTFPNPLPPPPPSRDDDDNDRYRYPSSLRVAVLDSPDPNPNPWIAAMLVPIGRHRDWIFSTIPGHLHLLLSSPSLSRLILIGEPDPDPDPDPKPYTRPPHHHGDPDPIARLQRSLLPLLLALSPKSSFRNNTLPQIPFLSYEDDVASISPVDLLVGPVAGAMLVEDVRLDSRELRRRLRFKRAPNLVQSQVRLVPDCGLDPTKFRAETGSLVQPYLGPMVAGLSLWPPPASPSAPPKALCVGVGGGALLMCLRHAFGFQVLGVEADETVVGVAKKHFGLVEDEMLRLCVGDGIELIRNGSFLDGFDVVMVDLDFADGSNGVGAPPVEFVEKSVLLGAKSSLRGTGIVVVNVIVPADASFYERLVSAFGEVFEEIYEIDVGNEENYVLVAVVPSVGLVVNEKQCVLSDKLKQVGAEKYVHCTKRI